MSMAFLTACGGDPLGVLGHRSSEWIEEARSPVASTSTTTPGPQLVAIDEVEWWNQELGALEPGTPEEAIRSVYERRTPSDRFIQASPREIARAVPGIRIPGVAVPDARSITSQLYFAPRSDRLADDFVAAFGFWSVEPYTRSRTVGQVAVLTVDIDQESAARAVDGTLGCASFDASSVLGCSSSFVGDRAVFILTGELGVTWVWFEEGLRYELFLREGRDDADVAAAMIRTAVPLEELAFGEITATSQPG